MEVEKQATAALEREKSGLTTELQAEIDTRDEARELEAKSARVSDLEWKEHLAQLREDLLRTSSGLVEARNGETEKKAELTDQMR